MVKYSPSKTFPFNFNRILPFFFIVQLLFLCVSFSITSSSYSSPLEWNNDTSYPFPAGSLVILVGQDHCIYVFSGLNNSGNSVSNSYKINITAGSPREWIFIASMPIGVWQATGCAANDDKFFIFGGEETNGSIANFIQIYNAEGNSWNIVYPNIPTGASIEDYWMSCAVDSSTGLMYITGGANIGNRFYSYNVSSNTITNLSTTSSPTPFNLGAQGSFVINGKLYLFGGGDYFTEDTFPSTHIYDIANHSWSTGNNMTQAIAYFGYATDGSRFYVIGGAINTESYLNYTQVYDISSGEWSINNGPVYSEGIFGNGAVFLDGTLHSIGGFNQVGGYLSIHRIATLCGVYTFNGTCDDENQCTLNDSCHSDGQCIGTSNMSCPTPSNPCQSSICNSIWGCDVSSGTPCSSSNKCLLNSTCSYGNCTGQSKICSNSNCDFATGKCVYNDSSSRISASAIAGIIIGLLVFIVIGAVAVVLLLQYERKRKRAIISENSVDLPTFRSNETSLIGNEGSNYSLIGNFSQNSSSTIVYDISSNIDSSILQISKMEIKSKIGEGAFGSVYLGVLNMTEVAIKFLTKENATEEDIKAFMAEAELMKNLPAHPNVVMFRGITVPPDPLSIVTDYCNGGSLSEYLKNHPKIPISEKIQFIKDIAKGMLHLHCAAPGKEVIHRDLASRNILLKNGVAIITDFGLSRVKASIDDYQKTQNNVGPVKWMSPESLFENKYSTKSDVFSFGVVIYEILTQDPPWKDLNPAQAVGKVSHGYRMVLPESCECPPALKDLMEKCWVQLPENRPDFEEICEILEKIE